MTKSVEIYDKENRDRLLGYLVKRPVHKMEGRYFRMQVAPTLPLYCLQHIKPEYDYLCQAYTVTFEFDFKPADNGWVRNAVMVTDASLELLQKLPDFRLPGEDEHMAHMRRHYR
jgi:hypothetical protein